MGSTSRVLVAALAAVALGVTAVGCGSDDGDDESAAKPAAERASASNDAQAGTGEGQVIRRTYARLTQAVLDGRPAAACAAMTPETRRTFGASGKRASLSCAERIGTIDRTTYAEDRPEILGVKVNGVTARLTVKSKKPRPGHPNDDSQPYTVPFTKVDGEWKLGTN